MNILSMLQVATAVGVMALAIAVLIRNRGWVTAAYFLLFSSVVSAYLIAVALLIDSADPAGAERWLRVSFFVVMLLPGAIWGLTSSLERADRSVWKEVITWSGAVLLGTLLAGSDLLVESIERSSFGFYGRLTPFGLVLPLVILASVGLSWRAMSRMSANGGMRIDRVRFKQIALGLGLGLLAIVDAVPAYGIAVPPLGFLALGAMCATVASALWKYPVTSKSDSFSASRLLEAMQEAVFAIDMNGRVTHANPAAAQLFEMPLEDLKSISINELIQTPFNVGPASHSLMTGRSFAGRPMVFNRKVSSSIEVSVSATMLRDSSGVPVGQLYVANEIEDEVHAEQLNYRAFHDPLTGLPNRAGMKVKLQETLEVAAMNQRYVAVIVIDIDRFSVVNDSRGPEVGDAILREVSSRLRDALRAGDVIARLAGDHFTVVLDMGHPDHLDMVVSKLDSVFAGRFEIEGEEYPLTASFGMAVSPKDGERGDTLLQNAEAAWRVAKRSGPKGRQRYEEEIATETATVATIQTRLRSAIENGDLRLFYQPVINLDTEEIVGCEALVRWQDGKKLIPPAAFIGVAEDCGLIEPLGEWVLQKACSQLTDWTSRLGEIVMSVNLSVAQIESEELSAQVGSTLNRCNAPVNFLELEITESSAMRDADHSSRMLQALKDLGVRIAIDDFGTGYASMSYLQRLPVDKLKIDRSFINELDRSRSASAIVSATIAMANALRLEVTAEGIENRFQYAFLHMEKCDFGQGFMIAEPLPAADFERLWRQPVERRSVRRRGSVPTFS